LVALAIHRGSPFSDEIDAVAVDKSGNPRRAHVTTSNLTGKILYHLTRGRQGFLCEVFSILYELCFLLWVKFALADVFGFHRGLTLLVSPAQRGAVNFELNSCLPV
jgi:hypothetical protein